MSEGEESPVARAEPAEAEQAGADQAEGQVGPVEGLEGAQVRAEDQAEALKFSWLARLSRPQIDHIVLLQWRSSSASSSCNSASSRAG